MAGLPSYTSEVMLSVDVAVAIALLVAFALVMWVLYMALAVLIVDPVSKMVRFWKDWRFSRRFEAKRRTDPDFAARFRPPRA